MPIFHIGDWMLAVAALLTLWSGFAISACGMAGLACTENGACSVDTPARTVKFRLFRGNSSVGRARPCQGRGREFESRFPLQVSRRNPVRRGFVF